MCTSARGLSSSTGAFPLSSECIIPLINILSSQVERSHPLKARLHQLVTVDQPLWDILLYNIRKIMMTVRVSNNVESFNGLTFPEIRQNR